MDTSHSSPDVDEEDVMFPASNAGPNSDSTLPDYLATTTTSITDAPRDANIGATIQAHPSENLTLQQQQQQQQQSNGGDISTGAPPAAEGGSLSPTAAVSGGGGGVKQADETVVDALPGSTWNNKKAHDDYSKAFAELLDQDFTLNHFGDPYDEDDEANRVRE
ncbi:MAG: hypothetical protein M1825_003832 [Sarcosagium campestre]|nr:MAG: hypothetical protein M1825_003832 [Sarcosagium campestre]